MTKKAQGAACNLASDCKVAGACGECASGNCVNGTCCDKPCFGECESCRETGSVGTCTFKAAGACP